MRHPEGRYLLRSNLCGEDPAKLWAYDIQLTEVEQAFNELGAFLAYCLQVFGSLPARERDRETPGRYAKARAAASMRPRSLGTESKSANRR